jgi:hypothetical protein
MSVAWPCAPPERLVDHHARVRQRVALAHGACRQQQRAHARRLADAHGADVRLDELHGVVDRHARGDDATRRVDVQVDVLVGILGLQEQQLRHDHIGHVVVDRPPTQEDHALLQQARVDVVGALAAAGLLDHHRHQIQALISLMLTPPVGRVSRRGAATATRRVTARCDRFLEAQRRVGGRRARRSSRSPALPPRGSAGPASIGDRCGTSQ